MADATKKGFWSHWPALTAGTAAVLTAIGTLLGGLSTAGVIGGGDGDERAQQSTAQSTATETTTSLPFVATDDEKRLAAMVPVAFHGDCGRADDLAAPTVARLFCQPPEVRSVAYYLFGSGASLNKYMRTRLAMGDRARQCGQGPSGSSTYRNAEKETVGRLVCYVRNGRAWIEWSNQLAGVYAYASRGDKNWQALFNFWTGAGPNP